MPLSSRPSTSTARATSSGGSGAYPLEDLAALNSPVADLFRIETSRDWSEVQASVHRLRQSIPPAEAPLREAFETWLRKLILPRLGVPREEASAASTLEEIETMLLESIDRWDRELREKALQEGRQEDSKRAVKRVARKAARRGRPGCCCGNSA
jgi:hypothetical protein